MTLTDACAELDQRSNAQWQDALNRSRVIREQFFGWRDQVAAQDRRVALAEVADVLELPPTWIGSWRLERVLRAVRSVGVEQARSLLRRCAIDERARGRDLTPYERAVLVSELRACSRTGVVGVLAVQPTKGGSRG